MNARAAVLRQISQVRDGLLAGLLQQRLVNFRRFSAISTSRTLDQTDVSAATAVNVLVAAHRWLLVASGAFRAIVYPLRLHRSGL